MLILRTPQSSDSKIPHIEKHPHQHMWMFLSYTTTMDALLQTRNLWICSCATAMYPRPAQVHLRYPWVNLWMMIVYPVLYRQSV